AHGEVVIRLRLTAQEDARSDAFSEGFDETFKNRLQEADEFYASRAAYSDDSGNESCRVSRQAYAGLLWSKQFYHYVVKDWIEGDPDQPAPPASRQHGRNHDWPHLFNRDVISMPDKWEYPWYAAWDLAFHMIPMAKVDPEFAKSQLELFLREWYMHPNGQIPAYEFAFSDVNPPVHAWACWRVYKMTGPRGQRDRRFLSSVFKKLLINFTWWVNRKDVAGNHLFSGGFLGLDNIGVFDRSKPLPGGGHLEQADGTAWMAFYCATMLSMALELAQTDSTYEDIASKFFEHFIHIADAMNSLGGFGLWDEADGFYYDQLKANGTSVPVGIRSIVGVIPLFAVEVLEEDAIDRLPGFRKRMEWFLTYRPDLTKHISYCESTGDGEHHDHHHQRLLAIPSRDRLIRVLKYVLDENEFFSPHGIRALSRYHKDHPYVLWLGGEEHRVDYVPGESTTGMFGGNSNWRGPIWFPINYLLVEALERYYHFYGDSVQVECPTGSGRLMNLQQVANELASRLVHIFLPDDSGRRPCHGDDRRYTADQHWRDLPLFYEYFHGDTGRGIGASHQTGWTALVASLMR
ncbi:MAG: glucosidase, partial [Planctomycetota bacterium]